MTEPVTADACSGSKKRDVGHALHPAGDDHAPAVEQQRRTGQVERLEARATRLVDGDRWRGLREARANRDLARRIRPRTQLAGLAKDHLVDIGRVDTNALTQPRDHRLPELDRGQRRQPAHELADGRPKCADDADSLHPDNIALVRGQARSRVVGIPNNRPLQSAAGALPMKT